MALGFLSFSVLIFKRYHEDPPRPWNIWILDTSKQGISQLLSHFINVTISIALTYKDSKSDECLWYFITNILDNTLGVLACLYCLLAVESKFTSRGRNRFVSGNYYFYRKVDNIEGEDKFKELEEEQYIELEKRGSSECEK